LQKNISLARYTTLEIGGPSDYFTSVETEGQLEEAIRYVQAEKIPWLVIGSGSNLLVSDHGFRGLVIKNGISGIKQSGRRLLVKGGTLLQELVDFSIRAGLGGLEKMTGIPGTVAGAIYGNAGAYGQTISDCLVGVDVFNGREERSFIRKQCGFSYRESIFKKRKNLVILEAEFTLGRSEPRVLQSASQEIRTIREAKYPPGLRCPGSFFKNLQVRDLAPAVLSKIPREKVVHGKVPAGYLLEEVGAKGQSRGEVRIASYHGNLFFNDGKGTARDFISLAREYQRRVKEKFGVLLEPEVQLVGFENDD